MIVRQATLAALASFFLAGPSLAAPTAAPAKTPPVFGSDVSIVSLPVFVVDSHGKAMRGLTAADFQLFDDGKPVRAVSFQYVDTTSDEAQDEIRDVPAARRHFLLLFDLSFTDPGGLHRARVAAKELVRLRLADTDLAAVATFDFSRGVRLVANFSEDRALLSHAIDTLGVTSLTHIDDPLSLAASVGAADAVGSVSRRTGEDPGLANQLFLAPIARRFKAADDQLYRAQVSSLIDSLGLLARSLRGVEGRKQILYFSAGFDSHALVGSTSNSDLRDAGDAVVDGRVYDVDSDARYGDSRLRSVFTELTRQLSNSDCVVHSVDVTGLGSDHSLTQTEISKDPERTVNGRESLSFLASETGGRFFKDTNDLGTIMKEVLDMTSRYYILGYQPEDLKGPGNFHKLKVKVLRRGGRSSYRAGFYEREPLKGQMYLQRKFEAAQLVMTGLGPNRLHFQALCLPFPATGNLQTLGLVVQVPKEEIRWEKPLALELYGYAVGADGSVLDHLAQLARLDPREKDPENTAKGLSFYGTLQVPPGQYTVKLMLLDPENGESGVQFLDVMVPENQPQQGFLLPPVLADDPSQWLALSMAAAAGRPEFPFATDGQVFLPRASFQVKSGQAEKLMLILYEPDRPGDPAAPVEIKSSVTDSSGKVVPGGQLSIDRVHREKGGRRTYELAYTPERLAPGDYTLRIGVGEERTLLESYSLLRVGNAAEPQ